MAGILLRQQINFACSLVVVHFRLALYRLGMGAVSAASLVEIFNRMQGELHDLMPALSSSAA